jgi:guanidinobutyrase
MHNETTFNQPLGGNAMPRCGGIATMMRLPHVPSAAKAWTPASSACRSTSARRTAPARASARASARRIRAAAPLQHGDARRAVRFAAGGRHRRRRHQPVQPARFDPPHRGSLRRNPRPRLQADLARRRPHGHAADPARHRPQARPVGLSTSMRTRTSTTPCSARRSRTARRSAAPSKRACCDCEYVVQIGLRGTGYEAEDFDWCREQGFTVVQAEECWNRRWRR